jgi:UDP-N-acetylmuramoylalanine--D-glutamate ligase
VSEIDPLVKAAYKKDIPVISEIELAYRFLRGKIIAITGTTGNPPLQC